MTYEQLIDIFIEQSIRYHRVSLEERVENKKVPPLSEEWLQELQNAMLAEFEEKNVVGIEANDILDLFSKESGLSREQINDLPEDFIIPPKTAKRAERFRQFRMIPTIKQ